MAERSRNSAEIIQKLFSEGVDVVNSTGEKLQELVPEITKTSSLLAEVVSSSVEQSLGAMEINNSIQGLNDATQTNAQISDQMLNKATELSQMASELQDKISFFKTKG